MTGVGDFANFLDIQTKTAWGRTLAEFASFCNPKPASLILDMGCGPGLLPSIFTERGHLSYGVDLDFSLLKFRLYDKLIQADARQLPFRSSTFDLLTAVNLLFLLDDPVSALSQWRGLLKPGGAVCLLNPSEHLSVAAASQLAHERGLDDIARDSLVNWARIADAHVRWAEYDLHRLFSQAGLELAETSLRVGPGFARLARGKLI